MVRFSIGPPGRGMLLAAVPRVSLRFTLGYFRGSLREQFGADVPAAYGSNAVLRRGSLREHFSSDQ